MFARERGSVAAPTAGLHFTPALNASLAARGIDIAEITLHVGYGLSAGPRRPNRGSPDGGRAVSSRARAHAINCTRETVALHYAVGRRRRGRSGGCGAGGRPCGAPGQTFLIYLIWALNVGLLTNFTSRSSPLFLVSASAGIERAGAWRNCGGYRPHSHGVAMVFM